MRKTKAEKILADDLANIAKRVKEGKPLTARQRALIETESGGPTTQALLAEVLGVTRQNLNQILEDPTFPKRDAAGRWNVKDCRAWLEEHGRAGADTAAKSPFAQERLRQMKAKNDRIEFELGVRKKDYILVDQVKRSFTTSVIAVKGMMRSSEARIGMKVRMRLGLNDDQINELVEIVAAEHREIQLTMSKGEWYMQECPNCGKTLLDKEGK